MILIVDDRPENILSLKKTLEIGGFQVDSAGSGEEALRKILNKEYSLIILDVQMPGMDGFEVAETISGYSKAKDVPIIFLSAVNTDKKFIAKGYKSGGVDYVAKPVDPDILMLKVKTLHKLHEQKRELNKVHQSLSEEIATRKFAQEQLVIKIEELRFILESIPQAAFTLNPTGAIEFVNEYWFLYANRPDELPQFHPGDVLVQQKWKEALESGEPLMCEVRIKNIASNEYCYHMLKMIPIRQRNKIVKWVGTLTDIHEQKSLNQLLEQKVDERTQELLRKNEELEERNHELQQFAYVASHDLKEPLRKVQMFGSILQNYLLNRDETAHSNVMRIIESSQRMATLIEDLLRYSRLSTSSLYESTDIRQILIDIIPDLELSINEKKAIINIGDMPVIDAIPGQMRQVFQNLLSNSLKYAKSNTPSVINIVAETVAAKSFNANPDPFGRYCRITVEDNGIGFNEAYVHKIFKLFQRLHTRQEYEGTGIGLAIVKKIIEKHHGIITATGKEDNGARFTFVLPLAQRTN